MTLPTGQVFTPNASVSTAALSAVAQTVALPSSGSVPQGSTPALVVTNPNSAPILLQLVSAAPAASQPPPTITGAISVHAGANLLIQAPNGSFALIAATGGGAAPITLTAGYVSADAVRFPDPANPQNTIYTPGSTQ